MSDTNGTDPVVPLASDLVDALDALAQHLCDRHHGGDDCVRCRAIALAVAANALGLCPEPLVPLFVDAALAFACRAGLVRRIPPHGGIADWPLDKN